MSTEAIEIETKALKMAKEILAEDFDTNVPVEMLETKQKFVQYCTEMGVLAAEGVEMLAQKCQMTPELRKKISGGNYAIGDERQHLITSTNIIGYAMAMMTLKIMDDTSPEVAIANLVDCAAMSHSLLAEYYLMKQNAVVVSKDGERSPITPELFFRVIAERVTPDES